MLISVSIHPSTHSKDDLGNMLTSEMQGTSKDSSGEVQEEEDRNGG